MRIPVFARRSNPAVDQPILRKSESYANQQVESGLADWVDPFDHSKGIMCRAFLHFGEKIAQVETVEVPNYFRADGELRGVRFVPPPSDQRPSPASIREGWDWQLEPVAV